MPQGLMAGWLADEILLSLEIFKIICITLRGQIKGPSRNTTEMYIWKEGYNSNVSWESYAHDWWINL